MEPTHLLILIQAGIQNITEEDVLAALPPAQKALPRRVVKFGEGGLAHARLPSLDWVQLKHSEDRMFEDLVHPHLASGALVAYFGLSAIPAIVNLATRVGNMTRVDAYHQHHNTKVWIRTSNEPVEVNVLGPKSGSRGNGDIIVTVSVSQKVVEDLVLEVVPNPLAEFHIQLAKLNHDCTSHGGLLSALEEVLRQINHDFPNRRMTHVFIASPPAIAFLLSTKLNPMIHFPIRSYQHHPAGEKKYVRAIDFGRPTDVFPALSEADLAMANTAIVQWRDELAGLARFQAPHQNLAGNWVESVVGSTTIFGPECTFGHLPRINEVNFSSIALGEPAPEQREFSFLNDVWTIGAPLLACLARKFTSPSAMARAARLFFLHEALHLPQRLVAGNVSSIGRMPEVIEAIDYEADVWAILHNVAFESAAGQVFPNVKTAYLDSLNALVDTLMAFDAAAVGAASLPYRRVRRYLIWMWNIVRIESLPNSCSATDIVALLLEKPTISIAGPDQRIEDGRLMYDAANPARTAFEVAVYVHGRLYRMGDGFSRAGGTFFLSLRDGDKAKMLDALRTIGANVL